jgi:hypothetical protein
MVAAALGAGPAPVSAQSPAEEVGLEAFAWLAGTWQGQLDDGSVAEIHFMPAEAGVLPAVFRLWNDERTLILETITVVQEEGRIVMYVRHFSPALVPMETEGAIALVLVGRQGETLLFENANEGQNPRRSWMRRTADGFVSASELARPDGSTDEIRVEYRRTGGG